MGRSAKFLKRTDKKTTSSAGTSSQPISKPKPPPTSPTPNEHKKRAGLKAKAGKHKREGDGPVLGGADYVDLMLGGRRKAAGEARKIPRDSEP